MNDVVIRVKADNVTSSGLSSAKKDFDSFGKDVERSSIKAGDAAGKGMAESLSKAIKIKAYEVDVKAKDNTNMGLGDAHKSFLHSFPGGEHVIKVKARFTDAVKDVEQFGRKAESTMGGIVRGVGSIFKATGSIFENVFNGAKKIESTISGAMEAAGPALKGALIAAVPLVAPFIGATISAAVSGGAAGLGIIGGVLLAAKDPRVKAAGTQLGQSLLGDLTQKADVFVGPIIVSIGKIKAAFADVGDDISRIFSASSKYVAPLVDGILRGAKGAIHGIADAVEGAGPVVQALGDLFDDLGNSIGQAFKDMTDNPQAAAGALREFSNVLSGTIQLTGKFVGFLTDAYAFLNKYGILTALSLGSIKPDIASIVGETDAMKKATADAAKQSYIAADATKEQASALSVLSKELQAQADPVFGLLNAQDKLRAAQQKVSKSTEDNGRKSRETKAALRELASAALDVIGRAGALPGAFDGKMTPAMRRALTAAGLTKNQIRDLAGQMRNAKSAADALAGTYRVNVVYNVQKHQVGGLKGSASAYAHGGIVGAAASGGVRSGMTLVGEEGPELVELPVGSRVNPAGTTRAMMSQGGGAMELVVRAAERSSYDLMQIIVESLRYEVRTKGQGSVQRYLGPSGVAA